MSESSSGWAEMLVTALAVPEAQATAFITIAAELKLAPDELIRLLVARVVEVDARMRRLGMNGLGYWRTGDSAAHDAAADVADDSLHGLPLDVRESGFMWPDDIPFPWSAAECRAAVLGYQVRWPGTFEDFCNRLRGMWEMSDGYGVLLQR